MMVAAVKVSGTGSNAPTEQQLKEFFSFSGKIVSLEVKPSATVEGEEPQWAAYVGFQEETATETALLLTGSLVEGHLVKVEKAEEGYEPAVASLVHAEDETIPPASAATDEPPSANSSNSAPPPAATGGVAYAQQVISRMLARGYTLGASAAASAKAFDEKHQLSKTAQAHAAALGTSARELGAKTAAGAKDLGAKAAELNQKIALKEKVTAGVDLMNTHVNAVDEKYKLTEKSRSVFSRAEEVVSGALHAGSETATTIFKGGSEAGKAIASTTAPIVATGHAWVKGAVENVSSVLASVSTNTAASSETSAKGAGEVEVVVGETVEKEMGVEGTTGVGGESATVEPEALTEGKEAAEAEGGKTEEEPAEMEEEKSDEKSAGLLQEKDEGKPTEEAK